MIVSFPLFALLCLQADISLSSELSDSYPVVVLNQSQDAISDNILPENVESVLESSITNNSLPVAPSVSCDIQNKLDDGSLLLQTQPSSMNIMLRDMSIKPKSDIMVDALRTRTISNHVDFDTQQSDMHQLTDNIPVPVAIISQTLQEEEQLLNERSVVDLQQMITSTDFSNTTLEQYQDAISTGKHILWIKTGNVEPENM